MKQIQQMQNVEIAENKCTSTRNTLGHKTDRSIKSNGRKLYNGAYYQKHRDQQTHVEYPNVSSRITMKAD